MIRFFEIQNHINMKYLIKLFLIISILIFQSCKTKSYKKGLKLPEKGTSFELVQRAGTTFPGYTEDLVIDIGDITQGQTILTLHFGKEKILEESIREGEKVAFEIETENYVFLCERFKNKLIGNDRGIFRIAHAKSVEQKSSLSKERKKIETLLLMIEKSDVKFIRNGEIHSPKEAANHLRSKYERVKDEIQSYDEFISEIASKSTISGEDYFIQLKTGEKVKASDWYSSQNIE